MKVELDIKQNLQENANSYFEVSKKAKKKLVNLEKAMKLMEERLEKAKKKEAEKAESKAVKKRKKEWYEKFRWFFSSDGFLVIGGRDAGGNEVIVKKHMEEDDGYFHADIVGAPHTVVKTNKKEIPDRTMEEAATFAASFSNAWREGFAYVDVYSVKPEQVSKTAPSGEFLGKGAFSIKGKREWFRKTKLEVFVGVEKTKEGNRVIFGPKNAIKKNGKSCFEIKQGKKEKSEVAKQLKKEFNKKGFKDVDLDEIIAALPNGESELKL